MSSQGGRSQAARALAVHNAPEACYKPFKPAPGHLTWPCVRPQPRGWAAFRSAPNSGLPSRLHPAGPKESADGKTKGNYRVRTRKSRRPSRAAAGSPRAPQRAVGEAGRGPRARRGRTAPRGQLTSGACRGARAGRTPCRSDSGAPAQAARRLIPGVSSQWTNLGRGHSREEAPKENVHHKASLFSVRKESFHGYAPLKLSASFKRATHRGTAGIASLRSFRSLTVCIVLRIMLGVR